MIILVDVKSNNELQFSRVLLKCSKVPFFGKKLVGKGRNSEVDTMDYPYYPDISPLEKR